MVDGKTIACNELFHTDSIKLSSKSNLESTTLTSFERDIYEFLQRKKITEASFLLSRKVTTWKLLKYWAEKHFDNIEIQLSSVYSHKWKV